MRFSDPRFIRNDDVSLAVYEAGPEDGVPLLMVHGWPELAYSWTPMLPFLTAAGYRVIAPDVRGFGRSDAPADVDAYRMPRLMSDVEAVLDGFGLEQVTLVGHDWGGIIVWHAARLLSERISRVISLCTPHVARAPFDPVEIFRTRHGAGHYFVHFNDQPGVADALFAQDPEAFFRQMFRPVPPEETVTSEMFHIPAKFEAFLNAGAPDTDGTIVSADDIAVYVENYARSGFHGGLNLYRQTTANWHLAADLDPMISQPTLMISGERDLFLPPSATEGMVALVPTLERHTIKGCGHWMSWEAPEEASRLMIEWLSRSV